MLFVFQPSNRAPYRFQPTLDNVLYNASVTWNVFGQRYYLNINDGSGNLIVSKSLVASPSGVSIQNLDWADGMALATTNVPHGYVLGATVQLTLSGCSPVAYNGIVDALITGVDTFSYPLAADPGQPTAFGTVSYDINLVWGYFQTSTLVFRDSSQTFEVTP